MGAVVKVCVYGPLPALAFRSNVNVYGAPGGVGKASYDTNRQGPLAAEVLAEQGAADADGLGELLYRRPVTAQSVFQT